MLGLTVGLLGAGISQTLPALWYISQESAKPCLLSSTFPAKGTYPGPPTHPLFVLPPSQIVGVLCKMLGRWLTIPADSALFWWVAPLSGSGNTRKTNKCQSSYLKKTHCRSATAIARCGFFQSRVEK
jgi:hypothetical protein